jgi:alpha-D-ribose 1-methylphosphonate 5-triphosphate synthase subunit PhnI
LKKDPKFATGIVNAEAELNDEVRDALISKIADGDMTAIIFYLRRKHPEFIYKPTTAG